jgi:hypothetical protein
MGIRSLYVSLVCQPNAASVTNSSRDFVLANQSLCEKNPGRNFPLKVGGSALTYETAEKEEKIRR